MSPRLLLLLFILLLPAALVSAAPAALSTAAGQQPVEITADRLDADDAARTLLFSGRAVARQGELTINAERLHIHYREGGELERIVAEGQVRIVQGARVATGGRAEFFSADERVVLTGKPRVEEGNNRVEGEEITLFLRDNRSIVKGGSQGRVNAIFQPRREEGR